MCFAFLRDFLILKSNCCGNDKRYVDKGRIHYENCIKGQGHTRHRPSYQTFLLPEYNALRSRKLSKNQLSSSIMSDDVIHVSQVMKCSRVFNRWWPRQMKLPLADFSKVCAIVLFLHVLGCGPSNRGRSASHIQRCQQSQPHYSKGPIFMVHPLDKSFNLMRIRLLFDWLDNVVQPWSRMAETLLNQSKYSLKNRLWRFFRILCLHI